MQSHQQRLKIGDLQIDRLIDQIKRVDATGDEVCDFTTKKMHDLISVYREGVNTLVETAKQDVILIHEFFERELDQDKIQLIATVDALEFLTRGITTEDAATIGELALKKAKAHEVFMKENDEIRAESIQMQSLALSQLSASIEKDKSIHANIIEGPANELNRAEIAEKSLRASFEQHVKLLKTYSADIRNMNTQIAAMGSHSHLVAVRTDLMSKVNILRKKIEETQKREKERLIQISRNHETCREKLQAEIDLISDVQRLTKLCDERTYWDDDPSLPLNSKLERGMNRASKELNEMKNEIERITKENLVLEQKIKSKIERGQITEKVGKFDGIQI